jgi:chaperone BCS1
MRTSALILVHILSALPFNISNISHSNTSHNYNNNTNNMNLTCETYSRPGQGIMADDYPTPPQINTSINPQTAVLDLIFPGFSLVSGAFTRYTKIDLNVYLPILMFLGLVVIASRYFNEWIWDFLDGYCMSTADIRIDDEMYNMIMSWVATQQFSKKSRRFVANTNLSSRYWWLWSDNRDSDEEGVEFDEEGNAVMTSSGKKEKKVQFTPSFGTHYFWYKKRLLIFRRSQDQRQAGWMSASEREEISISSFGRNPAILKELLDECRDNFSKNDVNKTIIYRGGLKVSGGSGEPTWTRCVSRVSRPFSTVVLDEEVKKSLLDDMRDYLHPLTRRWYSNRGIPYRRGYLLYGPPGTGKSSLSFAVAGYFKLQIYIVSLNSPSMNEENLSTLFSELPKQCVVLLEDIDTAGLTHARDKPEAEEEVKPLVTPPKGSSAPVPVAPTGGGKISLSALLNILDGVASQEGRVLIMTTNHIEKLDEALIRPGRVDMTIKFDLANTQMITTIFQSIFATLEGDIPKNLPFKIRTPTSTNAAKLLEDEKAREKLEKELLTRKEKEDERVRELGLEIAKLIPSLTFSPAEIQGFFLKWKRQPEMAVKEAKGWVEKTLKEKKEKDDEGKKKGSAKEDEASVEKGREEWSVSL